MTDLGNDRCTGGCGLDGATCRGRWLEQRKCCPDCTHQRVPPPPGVQDGFWPVLVTPAAKPTSLRVITTATRSPALRDLPVAALRAVAAAEAVGESWLVAPDHTYAHVAQDGTVLPTTGWAVLAARTISRRTTP